MYSTSSYLLFPLSLVLYLILWLIVGLFVLTAIPYSSVRYRRAVIFIGCISQAPMSDGSHRAEGVRENPGIAPTHSVLGGVSNKDCLL